MSDPFREGDPEPGDDDLVSFRLSETNRSRVERAFMTEVPIPCNEDPESEIYAGQDSSMVDELVVIRLAQNGATRQTSGVDEDLKVAELYVPPQMRLYRTMPDN